MPKKSNYYMPKELRAHIVEATVFSGKVKLHISFVQLSKGSSGEHNNAGAGLRPALQQK